MKQKIELCHLENVSCLEGTETLKAFFSKLGRKAFRSFPVHDNHTTWRNVLCAVALKDPFSLSLSLSLSLILPLCLSLPRVRASLEKTNFLKSDQAIWHSLSLFLFLRLSLSFHVSGHVSLKNRRPTNILSHTFLFSEGFPVISSYDSL